ncbi:hypothetical protein HBJ58_08030 [Halomonas desiderata]|uniref:hypothetical protein n=1 Tax=Billgrantia desiderata TaxID=52021 RepID=UPI00174EC0EF|nr:hypothetical protein [Halomonas desiderata]MCE8011459.1 hypothetical protein [Halomonas desiderata]NIC36623.1 hypothetical protein [Halomonas desiderata]
MQHTTHSPAPYDPEVLRAWAEQAAYVIAAGDALWHYLDDHPTIPSTSEEH